ncbi:PEPxxWA-CTERM sorting domain-containing protein [Sphingopyxis sp.]|uniref:PEPxxWA-CTERM sorting domain-containing protein n=1 Tax=Sphingopyxis sp. TaxID=1908224 RepID=UPI003BAD9578
MKKSLTALALLSALAAPAAAQAAAIVSFDSKTTISDGNNFKTQLAGLGLTKYDSTGVSIVLDANSIITFYLMGSESSFNDTFSTVSSPVLASTESSNFQNNFGAPILLGSRSFSAGSLAGLLNFSAVGGKSATVGQSGFGIFLAGNQTSGTGVSTFYFGYDDEKTDPDKDYDDMIIRADVTSAVPEPATWALMLAGFGFVGGAMRANRRKATVSVSYA